LAAWNLLRIYPGDRWLPVRLGNYFAPWLFMALGPALIIALLGRRPWLSRVVLLLALVFVARYWPLLLPRTPVISARTNASELRVMTFNVNSSNRNASHIANLVRAESPDVIAMQELSRALGMSLQAELASEYPYFLPENSMRLPMGVFSRYPLRAQSLSPRAQNAHRVSVETPDGTVIIWNLHPTTALSQHGWESQRETLAAVAREIEAETEPLIVLGDFNTTDHTENYRLIADRLTDVHWSVGQGFAFTFPDFRRYGADSPILRPVVRIDHIFVSDHFTPQAIHVIPSGYGSDHLPVVATLRFTGR
jgi:endonuclease/exonuclease/phosphatase (EEP) superfamily protein YafD